jgi:hypothetical protein
LVRAATPGLKELLGRKVHQGSEELQEPQVMRVQPVSLGAWELLVLEALLVQRAREVGLESKALPALREIRALLVIKAAKELKDSLESKDQLELKEPRVPKVRPVAVGRQAKQVSRAQPALPVPILKGQMGHKGLQACGGFCTQAVTPKRVTIFRSVWQRSKQPLARRANSYLRIRMSSRARSSSLNRGSKQSLSPE